MLQAQTAPVLLGLRVLHLARAVVLVADLGIPQETVVLAVRVLMVVAVVVAVAIPQTALLVLVAQVAQVSAVSTLGKE